MCNNPFISVIINNYNYGSFIYKCINSVIRQTYKKIEIIIVDDGSTDNSRDVINSFCDSRIVKVFKKNGGQASAFNAGFEVAKGEIIAFLDSDDWWKNVKLERIVAWHNFLKGDYVMLQHLVKVWDNGKEYLYKPALYSGDCFIHTQVTGELGLFVGTSGLVFSRKILERIMPVPLQFKISADAYLTRTSFIFGRVVSIPEILGYYRKHNNAVLGNNAYSHIEFHKNILFPALNDFYKKNLINFRFDVSAYKTTKLQYVELHKSYLRNKIKEIIQKYNKFAFFGAGQYLEWLHSTMLDFPSGNVVAILDDNPAYKEFWNIIPMKPNDCNLSEIGAIVLASDCKQDILRKRCIEIFGDSFPIIDLYEGLPKGPYPK